MNSGRISAGVLVLVSLSVWTIMRAEAQSAHDPTAEKPLIASKKGVGTAFHTSDRCVACHNGMKTSSGEDVSIGLEWRASLMANSSRDPYWQGSVRRESIDHPQSAAAIENECSFCHMPAVRLADRDAHKDTHIFANLPIQKAPKGNRAAADGVTCSVCHQIDAAGLGTEATFNGNVVISKAAHEDLRPEYGPFDPDHGHQTIMHSSTGGYLPQHGDQTRNSALCGSCHTLYTQAIGPGGERLGKFPEQMPYQEWQHSEYRSTRTCQDCHMPSIKEPAPITALYGEPRNGAHRHVFVGSNFVMEGMLQDHRDELATEALPEEMNAAIQRTSEFLGSQAAKVSIQSIHQESGRLKVKILAQNLTGHKLPTAYPSRRAWLHVQIFDSSGRLVFESGALHDDGSIEGNINDVDPLRFEPHYREITKADEVEIYEPILGDSQGKVTTGLLNTASYLKDNRLLPAGFDKATADHDVAVIGEAASDPEFTDRGSAVTYSIAAPGAGPFRVKAELWFQPIGYRWAHNLAPYSASEPQRMLKYYEASAGKSAIVLASAEATQ